MKTLLGLTGKTGAGKSTVSAFLRDKGAFVIDGDIIAREVLISSPELLSVLADNFGADILEHGKLNRKKLAEKAFKTSENTSLLNSILHPAINDEIEKKVKTAFINFDVVVVDAAAIIESGFSKKCDKLAVVTAPEDIRKERIMKRDNISEKDALIRINGQNSDDFYEEKANYIIRNYEQFSFYEELKPLLKDIFKE